MKIEGKSPRQYVEEQFPVTVGHIPLKKFFSEVETLEQKLRAMEKERDELVDERDALWKSLGQAYYLVVGRSPEWSNLFGKQHAEIEIEEAINLLKQDRDQLLADAKVMVETLKVLRPFFNHLVKHRIDNALSTPTAKRILTEKS